MVAARPRRGPTSPAPTARRSRPCAGSPTPSPRCGAPPRASTKSSTTAPVLGRDFVRQEPLYRRYAAVERQADNLADRFPETGADRALQGDLARRSNNCAARPPRPRWTSSTPNSPRSTASSRISTRSGATRPTSSGPADPQNENQAAKERQDFLEKQIAEERQTLAHRREPGSSPSGDADQLHAAMKRMHLLILAVVGLAACGCSRCATRDSRTCRRFRSPRPDDRRRQADGTRGRPSIKPRHPDRLYAPDPAQPGGSWRNSGRKNCASARRRAATDGKLRSRTAGEHSLPDRCAARDRVFFVCVVGLMLQRSSRPAPTSRDSRGHRARDGGRRPGRHAALLVRLHRAGFPHARRHGA
jgi:hypothetical protein